MKDVVQMDKNIQENEERNVIASFTGVYLMHRIEKKHTFPCSFASNMKWDLFQFAKFDQNRKPIKHYTVSFQI